MPAAPIAGTVVDARGRPVHGARVFLVRAPVPVPDIAALTDAEGRFSLGAPAPGTYAVGAAGDGGSVEERVEVGAEGAEVVLRLGGAPGAC